MSDDLFKRFKGAPVAAPTPGPVAGQDDSGLAYRQGQKSGSRLTEAEVMAAIEKIPSMPTVVQQLLRRTGSTAGTTTDLEDLIKQDMGIAGRVLKLVNSPFYGLSQQVSSIKAAVDVIGLASLKSIAVAASTASILASNLAMYGYAEKGLWTNSCATAALAKVIGQKADAHRDEVEEYFCAALLRDIGMLVLGPFLAQHHTQLRREAQAPDILRRERDLLGFDHCWVGERVGEKWTLPKDLTMVIAHHHRIPPTADEKTMRKLAAVRLAERLTYTANVGLLPDHPFERHVDGVLVTAAGLKGGRFEELMKELPSIIAKSDLMA